MASEQWKEVARLNDLPDLGRNASKGIKVEAGGEEIFLVREGERVYACSNSCPHYGGPFDKGVVRGRSVTCPFHNATFNLEDGSLRTPPALDDLPVYDVKVEGGAVLLGAKRAPKIAMPSGSDSRHVLIVGAGAAGNAAAEMLRRLGFAGRITMVTREQDGPYDRPMLSKGFLSGSAEEAWLPLRPDDFYEGLQIDLLRDAAVRGIDAAAKSVALGDNVSLDADALLLATGSTARTPRFTGAQLDGVFTLRSAADARLLKRRVEKGKTVVLLGAGFIGMELASDLADAGMEVHVVAPESEPMMVQFGEQVGRRIRAMHEERGVRFHLGTTADQVAGNGAVESVHLSDGTDIPAGFVVAAFGAAPAVGYLEGSGLLSGDGGVPVSPTLETSAPGVYAAGDIAEVPYPNGLGPHRIEHWVVAEMQGRHAARAILGDPAPYSDPPFFWTRQCETSLKYIGFPAAFNRVEFRGDPSDGPFLAGYYRERRLVGAASIGMSDSLLALEPVIRGEEELPAAQFSGG